MRQLEQCCPPSAEKQRRFPIDLPADRGWSENAAARVRVAIRDSFPKLGDVFARYWRTASFHILLRFRRAFYCSCVWLHFICLGMFVKFGSSAPSCASVCVIMMGRSRRTAP